MSTAFYVSPGYVATYYDTATATPTVPSAPTGLTHTNVSLTGWTESWGSVVGASTYNVYVNSTLVQSGITGTSYTVTGRAPSTTYQVTVTAVNGQGESAQSAADAVTTLAAAGSTIIRSINIVGSIPTKTHQDIVMWEQDTVVMQLSLVNAAGVPIDITGATVEWIAQPYVTSASATIHKIATLNDASSGICQWTLASSETLGKYGNFYHQARLTDVNGNEAMLATGRLKIIESSSN